MPRLDFIGLCVAALALSISSSTADSGILGIWATQKNNGRVIIERCGAAVCGRVLDGNQLRANPNQKDVHNRVPAKRERRIKGLRILEDYSGGPREWQGGAIYDPQTGDESHSSTLTLVSPDVLEVRGCRLFFCRSETWTRER